MSNTRNRIRIQGDLADPYAEPVNQATGSTPVFPRARATRVDLAIYDNEVFQEEISQFTSLTLEIKPSNDRTGAPIVSKTVSAAAFNNDCSENQWQNGTDQHVTFELTATETQAFTVTNNQQDLWLVITGVSADGNVTVVGGAAIAIEDGGLASGAAPPAGDPTYYTKEQIDALLQALREGDLIIRRGSYERRLSLSENGKRIDVVREVS